MATTAILLLAAIAGCGLQPEPNPPGPVEDLDLQARPTELPAPRGGVISAVEVMRGTVDSERFRIIVHDEAGANACLYIDWAPGGGGGCGGVPGGHAGADAHVGMVSLGQTNEAGHVHLAAFVGPDVAALRILTNRVESDTILVPLAGAGLNVQLAVGFLPAHTVARSLVAQDARGVELGEYDLHDVFPGPLGDYPMAPPATDSP